MLKSGSGSAKTASARSWPHPSSVLDTALILSECVERSESRAAGAYIHRPTSLVALLVLLRSLILSRVDLQLENLALRRQIGVLQRSLKKRPKITAMDRLLWASLSRVWRDWRSALVIVKPETVVAWHRMGFRLFWTWKVRRGQPGRPRDCPRDSRPDPQDVAGESYFGCTPAFTASC